MSGILDRFRLDGEVALVTGAASGIGQAVAVALAQAGADVALVGNRRPLGATAAAVRAAGRRCWELSADLSEPNLDADALVAQAPGLSILVNGAGITYRGTVLDLGPAEYDRVMQVNSRAALLLSQAAARIMIPRGRGKIINVTSLLAYQGGLNTSAYAVAKHALAGITQACCNEWAPLGINVNAIAPGYTETELTAALHQNPARLRQIADRIPAGRWGKPEEIAGAAVYLASRAADYVHGETIVVDGGWMSR